MKPDIRDADVVVSPRLQQHGRHEDNIESFESE